MSSAGFGQQRLMRRAAMVVLAGALAFGLAACGRKGPLDPPPGAAPPEPQTQTPGAVPRVFGDDSSPVRDSGVTAPKRRIPLDALLE